MNQTDQSLFSVAANFTVLADPIAKDQLWLTEDELITMMPHAFRLMTQVSDLEKRCLPLLKGLEQQAEALAEYLRLQSQKIDLVMQHHLAQDQSAEITSKGCAFGGSGLTIKATASTQALEVGDALALRVFIEHQHLSFYAIAEVQHHYNTEELRLLFTSIREQDQDQIVRASLLIQQRQLRQRSLARQQQTN